jgi:hypothetical protein
MSVVICFTRGRSFYQIARARDLYVGLRDGRVVASGKQRAQVAFLLIRHQS